MEAERDVYLPTCSLPLNTYSLHPNTGFLASGGSLYFNTVFVPSGVFTVFVAAAKSPDGAKLGFALSTGEADLDPEPEGEGGRPERERLGGRPEWGREAREGGDAERRDAPAWLLSRSLSRFRSW